MRIMKTTHMGEMTEKKKSYNVRLSPDDAWAFEHHCAKQHLEPMDALKRFIGAFVKASKSCEGVKNRKVADPFVLKVVDEVEVSPDN